MKFKKQRKASKFKLLKFIKPKKKVRFKFKKARKRYRHDTIMDLDDLHDEETYSFFNPTRSGYKPVTLAGYRLKSSWSKYTKAGFKAEDNVVVPKTNPTWITVCLPDKQRLVVQPMSATE